MIQPLGATVRQTRENKGLGLREAARLADLSPSFLSRFELGQVGPPGEEVLRRLARVLGAEPDEWMLLAGRIPSDLHPYLLEPGMVAFLRETMAQGLTGAELLRLLKKP